jgi:hypothetical protein
LEAKPSKCTHHLHTRAPYKASGLPLRRSFFLPPFAAARRVAVVRPLRPASGTRLPKATPARNVGACWLALSTAPPSGAPPGTAAVPGGLGLRAPGDALLHCPKRRRGKDPACRGKWVNRWARSRNAPSACSVQAGTRHEAHHVASTLFRWLGPPCWGQRQWSDGANVQLRDYCAPGVRRVIPVPVPNGPLEPLTNRS